MRTRPHTTVLLICGLVLILFSGCKVPSVEKNDPGPGGMPRGIVDEGDLPASDREYPVYPDAVIRANGVYESTDQIETVREYYDELLGIEPVSYDTDQEVLTYETSEFKLVIMPLPMNGTTGTEIRFSSVDGAG